MAKDIPDTVGEQSFTGTAPVDLISADDNSRMSGNIKMGDFYSAADTGFISQNVYLYRASEGLATVVVELINRPAPAKEMGLKNTQRIMLIQPAEYPEK